MGNVWKVGGCFVGENIIRIVLTLVTNYDITNKKWWCQQNREIFPMLVCVSTDVSRLGQECQCQ